MDPQELTSWYLKIARYGRPGGQQNGIVPTDQFHAVQLRHIDATLGHYRYHVTCWIIFRLTYINPSQKLNTFRLQQVYTSIDH
jgi:hypothetical protein